MLSGRRMTILKRMALRAHHMWSGRGIFLKAVSFAMIGVVNVSVDATVFFAGYWLLTHVAAAGRLPAWIAETCDCASVSTMTLIVPNIFSWLVAVSGSYVMNSFITFAAESGRKLRWRAYGTFVASGAAGALINTTVLVLAARVVPVWGAKGLAILASFAVNFTLSHFVVFRHRPPQL
jgi:putative flippase GtrA